MTELELLHTISALTELPLGTVRVVVDRLKTEVMSALEYDEYVKLGKFGTFYTVRTKPRKLFGRKQASESRRVIRFRERRRK